MMKTTLRNFSPIFNMARSFSWGKINNSSVLPLIDKGTLI